ncbi:MAG: diguanylate cyclase [Pseudomonadales bacterium]
MKETRSHSIERIGRAIYPLRILGFFLFGINILLSRSKLGLDIDLWSAVGIAICLIYPHVVFVRYLKNEKRETEIKHMVFDMALQGVMTALVNFTPSIVLPYLIANSAANYSIRGIPQSIKGVTLAISAALVVGVLRNEDIVLHADPIELLGPFIYLAVVSHYIGYLSYVRGISLIRRRKEVEMLAKKDFLTGLDNRRSMIDLVQHNDERRQTSSNDTTLIMIDLDHFKQINDLHGHAHGDAVLVRVSELLRDSLRLTDVLARWGGEEFLVLLPHTDIGQGLNIAETIRQNIAESSISYDGIDHQVTATFGVACYGIDSSFEETIRRADVALYEGKQQGRNRVVLVSEAQ